jgi:uncharacterized protein (TIGR00369 family)
MSEAIRSAVARIFEQSPFIGEVGIDFHDAGPGWCEAGVDLAPRHLQHTGVAHAGLVSTLADHCGGGAAYTQVQPGEQIVTVEFKLNLLRPGRGERLSCRAQVLKPGRSFHVVEAEVFAHRGAERTLIAKLNATMAVLRA